MQEVSSPSTTGKYEAWASSLKPTAPDTKHLRMLISGPGDTGKSGFLNSIPRCCILDIDNKATAPKRRAPGTMTFNFPDPSNYVGLIQNELIPDAKAGNRPFDYVAIDMVHDFFHKLHALFGGTSDRKSWEKASVCFKMLLEDLYLAGYGWILVAHIKTQILERETQAKYLYEEVDLTSSVVQYANLKCDYMARFEKVVETSYPITRVPDGKGGFDMLPDKAQPQHEVSHRIRFEKYLGEDSKEDRVVVRQQIPLLGSVMKLREGHGWDDFLDLYTRSVSAWMENQS